MAPSQEILAAKFNCKADPDSVLKAMKNTMYPHFNDCASDGVILVSNPALAHHEPMADEVLVNNTNGTVYKEGYWSDIPPVEVTSEEKLILQMVAGVSNKAAETGALHVAKDSGEIVCIRKVGEGKDAVVVAHNVTNNLDIPGLDEVPFSQEVFSDMANMFDNAKLTEGFRQDVGLIKTQAVEIENADSHTYDIWVCKIEDTRIKVRAVTPDLEQRNGELLNEAREQTKDFVQNPVSPNPASKYENNPALV